MLLLICLLSEMAEKDMDVNARVRNLEDNMAEFRVMFGSMSAAIERLSKDVTSLQFSSVPKGVEEPQHSRQGQTAQQPPRAPI